MAFLHNKNGEDYKILGVRRSSLKGHNDYLVKSKSGQVIIAKGWNPKTKTWASGNYYGWGKSAMPAAKKSFKNKK